MRLKELYQAIGGNYEEAISRFMNEDMLLMFFTKYFDSHCFQELQEAMEAGNISAAFEAAHSLKGLTLSMAFSEMSKLCVLLTEDLRAGKCDEQTREYWACVEKEYIFIKDLWENRE